MNSTFELFFLALGGGTMSDSGNWAYESWLARQKINDEGVPQWLCELPLGVLSEEEFYGAIKTAIRCSELRALRKALWLLLQHRFHSVSRDDENHMISVRNPKMLLKAFRRALTIEKIEKLWY